MTTRIPAILLLSFLLLPALGGYAWLQYQKSEVKEEVEYRRSQGFLEEDVVLLRFSEKESQRLLRWEHEAEFEYLGQMYDIVKTEAIGDSLYYWCFWDQEETRLNQEMAKLTRQGSNTNPLQQAQHERLTDFFKTLFLEEVSILATSQPIPTLQPKPFYSPYLQLVVVRPPTPPPQL